MWAMKLWDEGYKRITKEMIREQPADDSELVRGGSAGLAEAGNIGINLQDLSRSITNLVAPMPVVVDTTQASSESKQPRQHSAASSSRAGSGGQAGDCSSNGPLGAFYVAQVESISSESPPPTNASLVPIENHPESNDEKAESGETGSTELKGLLGTGLMDGITVPKVLDGLSLHRYSAPQTPNDTTATFRKSLSDISHKSSAPELSAVAGAKPYFHGPSEGTSILMEAYDPASKNDAYMGGITGDSGLTESQQARSPHIQRRRTAEDQREQNQTTPPKAPEPGGRPGSKDQVPPAELTSCRQQLGAQQQVKEALESREDVEAPPIGALTQPQPHFLDGQQLQQPGNWGSPLAALAFQQHRFPPAYHQHAASALQLPAGAVEIDLQTEITWGNLIGEGGFGKVYASSYKGRQVAVKIQGDDCTKASLVEEFKREIWTMHSLPPHRNVLALLGACTTPPRLAIVTEFCPLGSVYGLLHSPGCHLSWAQIIYMCLGAASGMAHLHRHNVLHRDLKSANLLVDHDYTVKVADFGLSRVQTDLATMTGGLGTYQWMAPEVLGNQRYSEKADVYSFGIVMWECTAREIPYAGMQGMPAAMAVMNRGLRPEIPAHTPAPLADLIRNCWRPLPGQRPNMEAVAAALGQMYHEVRRAGPR